MATTRTSERRAVPRTPSLGRIAISFEDPIPVTLEVELLDMSARGFRITHSSKRLVPGIEVRYHREGATGRARVIWTHMLQGRSVSGLVIL